MTGGAIATDLKGEKDRAILSLVKRQQGVS
jgi:hypothetical protein